MRNREEDTLRLLDALRGNRDGLTVEEIAKAVDAKKPYARQLAKELFEQEVLEVAGIGPVRYRLKGTRRRPDVPMDSMSLYEFRRVCDYLTVTVDDALELGGISEDPQLEELLGRACRGLFDRIKASLAKPPPSGA